MKQKLILAKIFISKLKCKSIYSIFREDLSLVTVKVNKEYFVDLTQKEALAFISKKEKNLNKRIELLTDKSAKIKAHIAFVVISIKVLGDRSQ